MLITSSSFNLKLIVIRFYTVYVFLLLYYLLKSNLLTKYDGILNNNKTYY